MLGAVGTANRPTRHTCTRCSRPAPAIETSRAHHYHMLCALIPPRFMCMTLAAHKRGTNWRSALCLQEPAADCTQKAEDGMMVSVHYKGSLTDGERESRLPSRPGTAHGVISRTQRDHSSSVQALSCCTHHHGTRVALM